MLSIEIYMYIPLMFTEAAMEPAVNSRMNLNHVPGGWYKCDVCKCLV